MPKDIALFLYGFDVTAFNKYVNFKTSSMGAELTATLTVGNYTCTQFMAEIKRAMQAADPAHTYTVGLNRAVNSGLSNRMTISTSGTYLDILFLSGSNAANSIKILAGFDSANYTGSTSYTGSTNAGTILVPQFSTYDYNGPDNMVTNDGVKNVSATGIKETLVFAQMYFIQGQWKYITNFNGNTQLTEWQNFMKYATRQLQFEFTPSIYEATDTFYQVTLESTSSDSNGMGYQFKQQQGEGLYRFYDTGILKFRVIPT